MTSFLFLELFKTPLALIKTSIGGVYFGAAAFPFSKWTFSEKMQLNICFLFLPSSSDKTGQKFFDFFLLYLNSEFMVKIDTFVNLPNFWVISVCL